MEHQCLQGRRACLDEPVADCSWLYGYQGAIQASLAGGKPTWEFIESGTDDLGWSSTNGSTCNTTTNAARTATSTTPPPPRSMPMPGAPSSTAWRPRVVLPRDRPGAEPERLGLHGGQRRRLNAIFANLKYIDGSIQSYAPELLSPTQGSCTMKPSPYSTIDNALLTSCSGGDLSMTSSSATEPIVGMTKVVNETSYLFVEADRANGATTGTYSVAGAANQSATLVYDFAAHYDPAASEQGNTFALNSSGAFSDTLTGDNGAGSETAVRGQRVPGEDLRHRGHGESDISIPVVAGSTTSCDPPQSPTITSGSSATAVAGSPFHLTGDHLRHRDAGDQGGRELPQGLRLDHNHNGTATISGTPGIRDWGVRWPKITAAVQGETTAMQSLPSPSTMCRCTGPRPRTPPTLGPPSATPSPPFTATRFQRSPRPPACPAGCTWWTTATGPGADRHARADDRRDVHHYRGVHNGSEPQSTRRSPSSSTRRRYYAARNNYTVATGVAMTPFTVTFTGYPLPKTRASGLPTGVALTNNRNDTGTIAGIPDMTDRTGAYNVTLSVSGKSGVTTQASHADGSRRRADLPSPAFRTHSLLGKRNR